MHKLISESAKETLGIDILEDAINFLKERGFNVKVADAQNFNLGEKFEVIFAGEVLEHLDNFQGFFSSVRRHLQDNGRLILTVPNCFGLRSFLGTIIKGLPTGNPEHVCWFCEKTIAQLLNRFGFEIYKIDYVEVIFPGNTSILNRHAALRWIYKIILKVLPKRLLSTLIVIATLKK